MFFLHVKPTFSAALLSHGGVENQPVLIDLHIQFVYKDILYSFAEKASNGLTVSNIIDFTSWNVRGLNRPTRRAKLSCFNKTLTLKTQRP